MSESRLSRNLKSSAHAISDHRGFPLGNGSPEPRVRAGYVLTGNAAETVKTGAMAQFRGFLWKHKIGTRSWQEPSISTTGHKCRTGSLRTWIQKSDKLGFESPLTKGPGILNKLCTEMFNERILGNSDLDYKSWKPLPATLNYHESLLWKKSERKGLQCFHTGRLVYTCCFIWS